MMTFGLDLLPPEVMVRTNGIFEIVPSMLQDGHNPKPLNLRYIVLKGIIVP